MLVLSAIFASGGVWAASAVVQSGENGSVTGAGEYAPGALVTATAVPAEGYTFFRWTGDYGVADPAEPKISVRLPDGGTLTALFGRQLVVDPAGDGVSAYANLDDAVSAAVDYDTILMKPGVYWRASDSVLSVAKPIKIVSEKGADVTHVRGLHGTVTDETVYSKLARGLSLAHELAILKGISLFNYGADNNNVAIGLDISAGLAEYCAISNCRPSYAATAVTLSGEKAELRHSYLYRNKNNADDSRIGYGGVLRVTAGTVTNCVLSGNTVSRKGQGAVVVNGAKARLLDTVVRNTTVSGCGGGVWLKAGLVADCVFSNNVGRTGTVYQEGGVVSNCLVAANRSDTYSTYCAGIYSTAGDVVGCTVRDNVSYAASGRQLEKTAGTIRNTSVAEGLHALVSSDCVTVGAGVTVENCAFQSPSVNGSAVLNASVFYGSNDVCWIEADKVVGRSPLAVSFKAHCPGASSFAWDFGDGKSTSTQQNPSFTFQNPANYVVTLTCGGRDPVTLDVWALTNVAYCATDGGNVFPYDTPEKAARDLTDAMDAVYADGDTLGTVRVAAGTWNYTGADVSSTFTPWFTVGRPVHVIGPVEGEALFDAKRKLQTVHLLNPRAVLERITISNGRFDSSAAYGGALHMAAGTITNCVISYGFGTYGGGASVRGGTIWNSTFCHGDLTASGPDRPSGGLCVYGGNVYNSVFENNFGAKGSGLYVSSSSSVVSNCVIRGSTGAAGGGGGLWLSSGLVTHCVISNNTARGCGGGALVTGGTLRNCLITDNSSSSEATTPDDKWNGGGGGGLTVGGGTVEFCTVAYNLSSTKTRSDELFVKGGTIRNCVFLGKAAEASFDVYQTAGTVSYSCFREGVTVAGDTNTKSDVKLTSPKSGDFTPLYGSPALDSGLEVAAVTSDLRGYPRPINDAYDRGCYEMDYRGKMGVSFGADIQSAGQATEVTLTATVEGGTAPYTYFWTIGATTYETDSNVFKHTFGYGSHTVTLKVRDANGNESDPVTQEDMIRISAAVVYVSPNGSATWPYDTWERATADIADAMDATYTTDARNGTIYVADGTYTWPKNAGVFLIDVARPIDIIGTNAACKAVFDAKAEHKMLSMGNARASIRNVTLYRGKANTQPGGSSVIASGLISNCVFKSATASGASALYVTGGRVIDSSFIDSNAGGNAGPDRRGGGIEMTDGTIERCLIDNCKDGTIGALYVNGTDAVARDCVIRGCYSDCGAVVQVDQGLIERCVITNNTCKASQPAYQANFKSGAGLYVKGGIACNCFIAFNRHTQGSEATYAAYAVDGGTAYNNTVWANTMLNGATNDAYVASGTAANSIAGTAAVVGGKAEGNYFGLAPRFRKLEKGDWGLKSSSPAAFIGVKSYWDGVADPTDLVGNPRISRGGLHAGCYQNPINGLILLVR